MAGHSETRGRWLWTAAALAALLGSIAARTAAIGFFPVTHFDDAYMFFRYARNLLDGHGLAWNPADGNLYGPTSLLQVGLVAVAQAVSAAQAGVLLAATSWWTGMVAWIALAVAGLHAALERSTWGRAAPLLLTAWAALHPTALGHMLSGMDTALALLGVSLAAGAGIAAARRPSPARLLGAVAAAWLAFVARPDTALYAFGFPFLLLWLDPTHPRWRELPKERAGSGAAGPAAAVAFLALAGVALAIDALAKWIWLGDVLPLSFHAKQSGFYDAYLGLAWWNPVPFLFVFLEVALPALALLVLARRAHLPWLLAAGLPVVATFAYFFSVVQIMGTGGRFFLPALPLLVVAASRVGSDPASFRFSGRRWGRLLLLPGLLGFVYTAQGSLSSAFAETALQVQPAARQCAGPRAQPPQQAWWDTLQAAARFAAALPPGTRMAATEVGLVGALAPRLYLIDMAGLNDREIAHQGFAVDRILDREPDLIWFPHPHYSQAVESLLCSPRLRADYFYQPQRLDFGLAVRRDSPHLGQIRAASGDAR